MLRLSHRLLFVVFCRRLFCRRSKYPVSFSNGAPKVCHALCDHLCEGPEEQVSTSIEELRAKGKRIHKSEAAYLCHVESVETRPDSCDARINVIKLLAKISNMSRN